VHHNCAGAKIGGLAGREIAVATANPAPAGFSGDVSGDEDSPAPTSIKRRSRGGGATRCQLSIQTCFPPTLASTRPRSFVLEVVDSIVEPCGFDTLPYSLLSQNSHNAARSYQEAPDCRPISQRSHFPSTSSSTSHQLQFGLRRRKRWHPTRPSRAGPRNMR